MKSKVEKNREHDTIVIRKLCDIITKLLNDDKQDPIEALIQLGELAFTISRNENDSECVRNKYGVLSDEKGKSREEQFNSKGIPFQGLFYISHWLKINKEIVNAQDIKNWLATNKNEFVALHEKLSAISNQMTNKVALQAILQFGDYASDLMHLQIVLDTLDNFNPDNDLNDVISRYALARIMAILGESAKKLSNALCQPEHLTELCHKLGQCRDLVKLPYVMPRTAQRMQAACDYLKTHGEKLKKLFLTLRNTITTYQSKNNFALCVNNYHQWLSTTVQTTSQIPLLELVDGAARIKQEFKKTKRLERQLAQEEPNDENDSDSSQDDEAIEDQTLVSAVNLLRGYQNASNQVTEHANQLNNLPNEQKSQVKKIKKKISNLKKNIENCLKNYTQAYQEASKICEDLPGPNHEAIIGFDIDSIQVVTIQAKQKVKTPNSKLLYLCVKSVDQLYDLLYSLKNDKSVTTLMARDQCVAFLGQLFKEIEKLHREVLTAPTFAVWDRDYTQTILVRNQRLMHNIVLYDESLVSDFIDESVMPWRENFRAFKLVAGYHHEMKTRALISAPDKLTPKEALFFTSLHNHLGIAYTQLHQWQIAEQHLLLASQYSFMLEESAKNDGVACILHNLADVYRATEQWEKAINCVEQAWTHRKANLPYEHPYYISTLIHLGMCYEYSEKHKDALECYQTALTICRENNLNQERVLTSLASFYADRMNYPKAMELYEKLLGMCQDKNPRLYLLSSLQSTAIECGDHQKALQYYQEKMKLFRDNKPYFKANLGKEYEHFEQEMIGPVYILDLLGRDEEALELIMKAPVLSSQQMVLKLRLLRNLDRYTEAKQLAESMIAEGCTDFNCEGIYGEVLLELDETEKGLAILNKKCEEARKLSAENLAVQMHLSPFNTLCLYYTKKKQYQKADQYIASAMIILDSMRLVGLSAELFTTLVNYYRAHILSKNKTAIEKITNDYGALFLAYIKREHTENVVLMLEELIRMFYDHEHYNIAESILEALISTKNAIPKTLLTRIMHLYDDFSGNLIYSGNIERGINFLYNFLTNHCAINDKPACSYLLAMKLRYCKRLDFLCEVVIEYFPLWNDTLAAKNQPIYDIYRRISNLVFICCNTTAEDNKFTQATEFAQVCMRLSRRIYALLQESNPPQRKEFEIELFKQYWRFPLAIADFQSYSENEQMEYYVLFISLLKDSRARVLSTLLAQKINLLYFGGELIFTEHDAQSVVITIPDRWKRFLYAFNLFLSSYLKQGISTPLETLRMGEESPRSTSPTPENQESDSRDCANLNN